MNKFSFLFKTLVEAVKIVELLEGLRKHQPWIPVTDFGVLAPYRKQVSLGKIEKTIYFLLTAIFFSLPFFMFPTGAKDPYFTERKRFRRSEGWYS